MCCEFGPPDISLLGPPPRPPSANFNLECVGSSVLMRYDISPFTTQRDDLFTTSSTSIVTSNHQLEGTSLNQVVTNPNGIYTSEVPRQHSTPFENSTQFVSQNVTAVTHTTERFASPFPDLSENDHLLSQSNPVTIGSTVSQGDLRNTSSWWSDVSMYFETTAPSASPMSQQSQADRQQGLLSGPVGVAVVVLLSVIAAILFLCSLVLWYKRRLLIKEKQVKAETLPDEAQYLDNYRALGKLWRLPRLARTKLLLRRSSQQNLAGTDAQPGSVKGGGRKKKKKRKARTREDVSPTESTPIYANGGPSQNSETSNSRTRSPSSPDTTGYIGRTLGGPLSPINYSKFQTSMDRASCTTSGISSDGGDLSTARLCTGGGCRVIPNGEPGTEVANEPRTKSGGKSRRKRGRSCEHRERNLSSGNSRKVDNESVSRSLQTRTLPRIPTHDPPAVNAATLALFRAELCAESNGRGGVVPMEAHRGYTWQAGGDGYSDHNAPRILHGTPRDYIDGRGGVNNAEFFSTTMAPAWAAHTPSGGYTYHGGVPAPYSYTGVGYPVYNNSGYPLASREAKDRIYHQYGVRQPPAEEIYEEIPYYYQEKAAPGILRPLPSPTLPAGHDSHTDGAVNQRRSKKRTRSAHHRGTSEPRGSLPHHGSSVHDRRYGNMRDERLRSSVGRESYMFDSYA